MKTPNIYTAPASGYLITWRKNINTDMYRDASGSEFSGTDMLSDAQAFTSEADAQAQIDENDWTFCQVTTAPQDDVLVYRADSYRGNMGDLRGFFLSKDDAMHSLRVEDSDENGNPGDDFEQITVFGVSPDVLDGVDVSDNAAMLVGGIWGNGNIIETITYK